MRLNLEKTLISREVGHKWIQDPAMLALGNCILCLVLVRGSPRSGLSVCVLSDSRRSSTSTISSRDKNEIMALASLKHGLLLNTSCSALYCISGRISLHINIFWPGWTVAPCKGQMVQMLLLRVDRSDDRRPGVIKSILFDLKYLIILGH